MIRRRFLSHALLVLTLFGPASAAWAGSDVKTDAASANGTRMGAGKAYDALGRIPVLHQGRIKPLDTMARLELKDIYGPGDITLKGAAGGKDVKWSPVAAFLDWSARPAFWDEQEIILIDLWDYRGFKQELLAGPIKHALRSLLGQNRFSPEGRELAEKLIDQDIITEKDLKTLIGRGKLESNDARVLTEWAERLAEGRKRISPAALESAVIMDHGEPHSFQEFFEEVYPRGVEAERSEGQIKLAPREEFVYVIGKRLEKYKAFRDQNPKGIPEGEIPIIPRPYSEPYVKFTGELMRELADASRSEQQPDRSRFDEDVFNALMTYVSGFSRPKDYFRAVVDGKETIPGVDPKFDRSFAKWVREASNWIPLRLMLEAELDQLEQAGLPRDKVTAFRTAWEGLLSAQRSAPGQVVEAPALAVEQAARALGEATSPAKYPKPAGMMRETHFNSLDPFGRAPMVFGLSLAMLLVSLGINAKAGSRLGRFDRALYLGGVGLLALGIALEVYGFYLRIMISGWAPVTNMYETVIWVAFGSALLGLILEGIFRRKYAATAASGVALLATLLAANVPLLEPNIGQLSPVLRDNFWLTVHVLTIVSSYAAFSLVMGLGLLGTAYYLSATYRRDVPYLAAARPIFLGAPLALAGTLLHACVYRGWIPNESWGHVPGWAAIGVGGLGGFIAAVGLFALMGEFANRSARKSGLVGAAVMLAGGALAVVLYEKTMPDWWPQELPLWFLPGLVSVCGFAQLVLSLLGGQSRAVLDEALAERKLDAGASAPADQAAPGTPKRQSIADLVRQASQPVADPRGRAIQATVAQVKPLSNFLYRAMQVGVLLVATGTFLGGVWADKSWGRFWGWDPKEVWALITLIVYLIPLHGRFAGWVSTFGLVGASVVCYNSVLMAWYGVNWVLGVGLHSYGFSEGGGQGMVVTTALGLIALVGGAAWRRRLGSRTLARVESAVS